MLTLKFRRKGEWTESFVDEIEFRDSGLEYKTVETTFKLSRVILGSGKKADRLLEQFDCSDHSLLIVYWGDIANYHVLYVTEQGLRSVGVEVKKEVGVRKVVDEKTLTVTEVEEELLYFNDILVGRRTLTETSHEELEVEVVASSFKTDIDLAWYATAERRGEVIVRNRDFPEVKEKVYVSVGLNGNVHVSCSVEQDVKKLLPEDFIRQQLEQLQKDFQEWKSKVNSIFGVDVSGAKDVKGVYGLVKEKYPALTPIAFEKVLDGKLSVSQIPSREEVEEVKKYLKGCWEDDDTAAVDFSGIPKELLSAARYVVESEFMFVEWESSTQARCWAE